MKIQPATMLEGTDIVGYL